MTLNSQLFVAGPPVVSHATGENFSKEELGGFHFSFLRRR